MTWHQAGAGLGTSFGQVWALEVRFISIKQQIGQHVLQQPSSARRKKAFIPRISRTQFHPPLALGVLGRG